MFWASEPASPNPTASKYRKFTRSISNNRIFRGKDRFCGLTLTCYSTNLPGTSGEIAHRILRTDRQPVSGIESFSFAPLTREPGLPDQCSPHWYTGGPINIYVCVHIYNLYIYMYMYIYIYTYIYVLMRCSTRGAPRTTPHTGAGSRLARCYRR